MVIRVLVITFPVLTVLSLLSPLNMKFTWKKSLIKKLLSDLLLLIIWDLRAGLGKEFTTIKIVLLNFHTAYLSGNFRHLLLYRYQLPGSWDALSLFNTFCIYFKFLQFSGFQWKFPSLLYNSLGVRHDWATSLYFFTFMHWRRKWQPTPVFLPGESQERGSLVGCRLWGRTESDTTEAT